MATSGPRKQSETGFVGRQRELARLGQAFEDSRIERRCHLFTLLGSAGVGKSRLINEFVEFRVRHRARPARALPFLRRRHHVLADRRDRSRGGRDCRLGRRGRGPRREFGGAWGRPATPSGSSELVSAAHRPDRDECPTRRALPGASGAISRSWRRPRGLVCRHRRHPLGRAGAARPDRVHGRLDTRQRDSADLHCPTGAPRNQADLGRRQGEFHDAVRSSRCRRTRPKPLSGTLVENRIVPPAILRRIL